jgi:hypothetical protein
LERLAIYTCITDCYDSLKDPEYLSANCDYLCFTDEKGIDGFQPKTWKLRRLEASDLAPSLRSRRPKILPHEYLPDYEISVWIDGTYLIHGDLAEAARRFLSRADMALFRHAENRASIRAEADECCRLGKGDPDRIRRQVAAYLQEGFPDASPLPQNNIIFRRHHCSQVTKTMAFWWEQMTRHSNRDQLSLLYAVWKEGLDFDMYRKKGLKPFARHLPHAAAMPKASTRKLTFFKRLKLSLRHGIVIRFPGIYRC